MLEFFCFLRFQPFCLIVLCVKHYVKGVRDTVQNLKLGFIGVGSMASAMLDILLKKKVLPPKNLLLFDPDPSRLKSYADRGLQVAASNRELVEQSVLAVLAVKPQVLGAVLDEIRPVSAGGRFISIAAGVTTGYIKGKLDPSAQVVRVMPNTPLTLAAGATAIAEEGAEEILHITEYLFSYMGSVAFLPEDKLNEVIGVSGSSPAFFFRMAHVMAAAAQEQGISYDTALSLVAQTMAGSAQMLLQDGRAPMSLVSMVASPGGTTEAALASLNHDGFDDALKNAMLRCTERAYELGNG